MYDTSRTYLCNPKDTFWTVAHHGTLLGSESTYMKEAPKSIGIDPLIDYHCNPSQILPHFYVKNIFLDQILAKLEPFHWQPLVLA